jgi:filamentous hemagglutinin family protein
MTGGLHYLRATLFLGLVLNGLLVTRGQAEVTLDGGLGPAGPLPGPDFMIPDTVGQTVGTNLFHSFSIFNIYHGESATFTGPPVIDNVISRVTGGNLSFIDGPLRSEIGSANLWFINPAGVLFGAHASLDLQGSFHVSTADYLKLGEGGRFDATNPENSVLTTAPPESFGFLGDRPASIAFQGSGLSVPEGEILSVIGGDIEIAGGAQLQASSGRVNVASVASAGEVTLGSDTLGTDSFARLGRIDMTQESAIDVSGEGGGSVFIRGEQFFVADNSKVVSHTHGDRDGRDIDVKLKDDLIMENSMISTTTFGLGKGGNVKVEAKNIDLQGAFRNAKEPQPSLRAETKGADKDSRGAGNITVNTSRLHLKEGAQISTSSIPLEDTIPSTGKGGELTVVAEDIVLEGALQDFPGFVSGLFANAEGEAEGSGGAGNVMVTTSRLHLREGAGINSFTLGPGQGGNVIVQADDIVLEGSSTGGFLTGLFATAIGKAKGSGNAGSVTVTTSRLHMREGAQIASTTFGPGQGGPVMVTAEDIVLEGFSTGGFPTGLFANAEGEAEGSGGAGNVMVTTSRLHLREGAQIASATRGSGQGGNVTVQADDITLEGGALEKEFQRFRSGLFTSTLGKDPGSGHAGDITVKTGSLHLKDGAKIAVDTFGPGQGGDIDVDATNIELRDGSGIFAESFNTNKEAGESGSISITVRDSFRLFNGSSVSVKTEQANAGSIDLQVGNLLHLRDQGSITTSVAGGAGDGGNIFIDPVFTVLDEGSQIVARAREGSGGNIRITSDFFFQSPDSIVNASSEFGVSGTVVIDAPDTDIIAGFAELPANFLDAATVLTQLCAERSGANVSSLVFRKYEVLPDSPYALRVYLPSVGSGPSVPSDASPSIAIPDLHVTRDRRAYTCALDLE